MVQEPHQFEAPEGPRAHLAGNHGSLNAGGPQLRQCLQHAWVRRHSIVVVGVIVIAVGGNELLEQISIVGPFSELFPQWRPDSGEPIGIVLGGQTERSQRVVVAVDDEPDGIDECAVEIEQHPSEPDFAPE